MAGTIPPHPPSLNLIRVTQTHSLFPLTSPIINPSCKPKPVLVLPACTSSSLGKQRQFATSVAFNPGGNYDLSLLDDHHNDPGNVPTPLPPKEGRFEVVLHTDAIRRLDLSPFHSATSISPASSVDANEYLERTIGFTINYAREDPYDQRELSEIPDIRLWFVRLDAAYPWLPVLLDWRAGELARYAAMLVPHQMSMRMGVVFNPEALELLIMKKAFIVYSWMKQHGIPTPKARLKTSDMARMLGFGIGDELFDLIDQHPLSPSE